MKRLLLVVALSALFSGASFAAAPAQPNPAANPTLASLQKAGAKFFYLGSRFGLDGWFIVQDGRVQMLYATPDNKAALIGAIFGEGGENITAEQVNALMQSNKEVANLIDAAQKEQANITQAGSAAATTPIDPGAIPSVALSPGERLMHELEAASTVLIGQESTPEILMVMDPLCPYCQATWKALHEAVAKGKVHLRLIPAARKHENERASAILLGVSDPLNAWDKYMAGDKAQLAGTPSEAALASVQANTSLIESWKITKLPFLVYRAQDGKVKVIKGEPKPNGVSSLLSDLGADK
ncbi:MAG: thioredoxin fold domain-containing protein [Alphaproteobacteria bacterium]|nr:thioredoxin fold domain-containing protein [Alphaproteobacteria bacterium]